MNKGYTILGYFMLLVTAIVWGSAFVAQRHGMSSLGPFGFNGIRMLVGWLTLSCVIGCITMFGNGGGKGNRDTLISGGLLCGIVLGLASVVQQIGIKYTSVGKAGFITSLYIILVPALGVLFGQKNRLVTWLCVFLALFGFFLISNFKPGTDFNRGDLYCLAGAVLFSAHILLISHFAPKVDPLHLAAFQFLVSGVLSLVILPFTSESFPTLSNIRSAALPILYAGILSCGVAYTFQVMAQKWVRPVAASLIMSLESCFAALFGWLFLQERLSTREIAGCIVIFIAVIITTVKGE